MNATIRDVKRCPDHGLTECQPCSDAAWASELGEVKTLNPGAESRPASWKQTRYLRALVNDREVDFTPPPKMSEAKASELIDRALASERRIPDLKDAGFYVYDGELHRVRERQAGPGVYAELWRVEPGKRTGWKYVPGAVTNLLNKHKVSDELAATMMEG